MTLMKSTLMMDGSFELTHRLNTWLHSTWYESSTIAPTEPFAKFHFPSGFHPGGSMKRPRSLDFSRKLAAPSRAAESKNAEAAAMRAHIFVVFLMLWCGSSSVAKGESVEYPLCSAGSCKDNNCLIQPWNTSWPCTELSPCEEEGTYCFIDTYPYPEAPMHVGCGGSDAAKKFKKIRRQVDGKPRPEWWGLAKQYDQELSDFWEERKQRELKEMDGLLSPFMERNLRRKGLLPKAYNATKRRHEVEREIREEKERKEREIREEKERKEREERARHVQHKEDSEVVGEIDDEDDERRNSEF
ncbi:hypothetical protein BST61_g1740 [Cercospora zeina]